MTIVDYLVNQITNTISPQYVIRSTRIEQNTEICTVKWMFIFHWLSSIEFMISPRNFSIILLTEHSTPAGNWA